MRLEADRNSSVSRRTRLTYSGSRLQFTTCRHTGAEWRQYDQIIERISRNAFHLERRHRRLPPCRRANYQGLLVFYQHRISLRIHNRVHEAIREKWAAHTASYFHVELSRSLIQGFAKFSWMKTGTDLYWFRRKRAQFTRTSQRVTSPCRAKSDT